MVTNSKVLGQLLTKVPLCGSLQSPNPLCACNIYYEWSPVSSLGTLGSLVPAAPHAVSACLSLLTTQCHPCHDHGPLLLDPCQSLTCWPSLCPIPASHQKVCFKIMPCSSNHIFLASAVLPFPASTTAGGNSTKRPTSSLVMNMTLSYSRVHGPRGQYVVCDRERNEVSCPRAFRGESGNRWRREALRKQ